MYPDSELCEKWPYFVKDQNFEPREPRPVRSLTFLDPACGSGHFPLVAFDLFVQMYEKEARLANEGKIPREWVVPKEKIATTIIESNLHGIDIDLRSVQLSWLVLYLKMREHQDSVDAPKSLPEKVNLVAADASLLDTPEFLSWCEERFKKEPYVLNIIKGVAKRLHNLPEIGSLARPEEDLKELIKKEKERLLAAWKGVGEKQLAFEFHLTKEQQELPFDKVTDEQFWNELTRRFLRMLDVFLKRTREEMRERLFATDLQRVIIFLDLCRKRYDVVATNPPYMGSKNMGKELKDYVQKAYPEGKRDLYAAFIQRNREWPKGRGIVAMVTQQSWMFLRSFVKMREEIVKENSLQTLAHLGEHAFDDPAAAGAFVVLFTLANEKPEEEHRLVVYRLIGPKSAKVKKEVLFNTIKREIVPMIYSPLQSNFVNISESPLVYWLKKTFMYILIKNKKLHDYATVHDGMTTGDNDRFLRKFWEVIFPNKRWFPYKKGGGYCKWIGFDEFVVDWEDDGKRIKAMPNSFIRNEEKYFKEGLTYSLTARGSLGVRVMIQSLFDPSGISIFPHSINLNVLQGILNTHICSYILRAFSSSISFNGGYVSNLPLPSDVTDPTSKLKNIELLTQLCANLKRRVISGDICEREHDDNLISSTYPLSLEKVTFHYLELIHLECAILHATETSIEMIVSQAYNLRNSEMDDVFENTGTSAGWHPLITGYDTIPQTNICEIPKEVVEYLDNHKHINPSEEELSQIKSRLRALYEAGPGVKLEDVIDKEETQESDEENEADTLIGKRIPIPTETFLEELSVKMEIHPVSIYWLLKEMREKEGVVCWPEGKRYVEDYFAVMILRTLGFRWPKQIEAEEPVPEWADKDGIIPITDHMGEKTLLECIRDRIGAEFGEDRIGAIEQEFSDIFRNAAGKEAEIKGKKAPTKKTTLAQWLEREFFKRHTRQFKKRPIAWHLTSSNGTF